MLQFVNDSFKTVYVTLSTFSYEDLLHEESQEPSILGIKSSHTPFEWHRVKYGLDHFLDHFLDYFFFGPFYRGGAHHYY